MNNTFSIHRFGLLLKRQWLEFGKIYLIILGVALGVLLAFYGLSLSKGLFNPDPRDIVTSRDLFFREPLFLIFGFLFITVIASNYFAHLGQKPKAIIDLLIPASTFEKFLTGVFFTGILSTLSFVVLFYLTDLAFVAQLRKTYHIVDQVQTYTDANGYKVEPVDVLNYFFQKNRPQVYAPFYVIPLLITSIFLLGSVYFNRFHYIKTAIAVLVFSGLWAYIIYKSGQLLMDGRTPIVNNHPEFGGQKQYVELYITLLFSALTLIFWTISYVRLKEKEV